MADRPWTGVQENLLTILAYSDKGGAKIVDRLKPELFDSGPYRLIAERLLEYWQRRGKAPKGSTPDQFEDVLDDSKKSRLTYLEILRHMQRNAGRVDETDVLEQWREFFEQQHLKGSLLEMAETLQRAESRLGVAAKVKDMMLKTLDKIETSTSTKVLTTVTLDKFKAIPRSWVWWPFIPDGNVTSIYGDGGKGKSTITLDLAARITKGAHWPQIKGGEGGNSDSDNERALKGSVLILSSEDGPNEDLRPKLELAGADLTKVHVVGYASDDRTSRDFEELERIDTKVRDLERRVKEIGDVRLIVIDPITSYLGDIPSHDDPSVRRLIDRLGVLAREYKLAVVYILHLNKKTDLSAQYRGLGSVAFINRPRSNVAVGDHPDDPSRKVFCLGKRNYAPSSANFAVEFTIRERKQTVRVEWGEEWLDLTADRVLEKPKQVDGETKAVKAEALIRELLAERPMLATDVIARAADQGISARTVGTAKKSIGVKSHKEDRAWWWRLPKQSRLQRG
ncbi:MAG: AAA family ATPase [Hyphomicrobiales bacterium]|nr:AAA family ATPase [Hyphomicrobiales bacterium]